MGLINYNFSNKKLKPCPFCGGQAELLPQIFPPHSMEGFMIKCRQCSANKLSFSHFQSQAVCEWNWRCIDGKRIPWDQ